MAKAIRNLFQEVTNNIIKTLESGVAPWIKPWESNNGLPSNFATNRTYRGINIPILWNSSMSNEFSSDRWMTFQQAHLTGGSVKKGSKGTTIVFWKTIEGDKEPVKSQKDELNVKGRIVPILRSFSVFNEDQISGLPKREPLRTPWEVDQEAARLMALAQIQHGGTRAFYAPDRDIIQLPANESFPNAAAYYATSLHELIHWTGHQSRLDRLKKTPFGSPDYAREELVAEMGAAFLTANLGIKGNLQHPEYIASWLKVLREDNRAIFKAASAGQKAFDFIWPLNSLKIETENHS